MSGLADYAKLTEKRKQSFQSTMETQCLRFVGAWVGDAKKRTPVDLGQLRRDWHGDIIKTRQGIEMFIANNTAYAGHVEYGHRQEVGRYVPQLKARLVKSYVEGKYMMRMATDTAKRKRLPALKASIMKGLNDGSL